MLGALISSRVALMTYYSRPTLIQGLENTLGRPHGSIEPSFPLVEPGGYLGPPPKAKIALFARSPPPQKKTESLLVLEVFTPKAPCYPGGHPGWLEMLVSCYLPHKKGQQKFSSKVFPKKVNHKIFMSGVFQEKVNQFAPWNRYGPSGFGAP